ncbi:MULTISPECIES: hypothetical protein [Salipiger]|uniref:Uncharacterized protein n=1 Tax=Salipiger bermudensis (strain DSM 26914 / JCM 13377 / KCTC 12554 / HTCC2601) TaxID=314265 RepID=Q0FRA9_SALBH|nr:hypothetical protein [Salipiger bermudensis]EAU46678.1 hypothetical protein R2601_16195 [Salipiger bermudensis HTCC2601]MBN9676765.1 hypothetical protein [Salipiger bermudensis]MBR9893143.1 hypothetical protein [bacterium]
MKKALAFWLASASAAFAHAGHDAALPADGAAHWLLSPLHGLGVLALAGILWMVLRARRKE